MLELVPAGINKWVGMTALLADLVRAPLLGRAWDWGFVLQGHNGGLGWVELSRQCGSAAQAPLPALELSLTACYRMSWIGRGVALAVQHGIEQVLLREGRWTLGHSAAPASAAATMMLVR